MICEPKIIIDNLVRRDWSFRGSNCWLIPIKLLILFSKHILYKYVYSCIFCIKTILKQAWQTPNIIREVRRVDWASSVWPFIYPSFPISYILFFNWVKSILLSICPIVAFVILTYFLIMLIQIFISSPFYSTFKLQPCTEQTHWSSYQRGTRN